MVVGVGVVEGEGFVSNAEQLNLARIAHTQVGVQGFAIDHGFIGEIARLQVERQAIREANGEGQAIGIRPRGVGGIIVGEFQLKNRFTRRDLRGNDTPERTPCKAVRRRSCGHAFRSLAEPGPADGDAATNGLAIFKFGQRA